MGALQKANIYSFFLMNFYKRSFIETEPRDKGEEYSLEEDGTMCDSSKN